MAGVNEAMDKLRDEMAAAKDDSSIAVLGEYMTERLLGDEALAGAVLAKGKTLAGAFSAIREQAKKEQKGGFACIDDERACRITCEYYGISPHQSPAATASHSSRADALCAGATSPRESSGFQRGAAAASASRSSGGAYLQGEALETQALAHDALDLDALLGE